MELYFNHNKLQQEIIQSKEEYDIPEACKEFMGVVGDLIKQNDSMKVSDEWIADISQNLDYRKYAPFFQCIGRLGCIEKVWEENTLEMKDIIPGVQSETVRKILNCCLRDKQDKMFSLCGDEADSEGYQIIQPTEWNVKNFVGIEKVKEYHIYNPMPETIRELFEKIKVSYNDIIFTKKAFDTALKREEAYKKYGFERLLFVFYGINELLLPFYKGEIKGYSEAEIFREFLSRYKVEISPDTDKTMQMYGYQREVTINDTKCKMCNHIKIPVQESRIYFKYIDGKIYIGHSGEHLELGHFLLRKCGHFSEYFILGILSMLTLFQTQLKKKSMIGIKNRYRSRLSGRKQ